MLIQKVISLLESIPLVLSILLAIDDDIPLCTHLITKEVYGNFVTGFCMI